MENSDDLEIVIFHPDFMKMLIEIQRRAEQREKMLRKIAEIATSAFEAALKAVSEIVEQITPAIKAAADAICELMDKIEGIDISDERDKRREIWKSAQRRFAEVEKTKMRQFGRNRNTRTVKMYGNIKIGGCGRRAGPKKARNQ